MEGATTWPLGQTELASAHHLPKLRYWLATADGFAAVVAAIVPSLVLLWRGGLGDHLLVVNVVAPTLVILLALVIAAVSGQYSDQRRLSRLHDVGTLAKVSSLPLWWSRFSSTSPRVSWPEARLPRAGCSFWAARILRVGGGFPVVAGGVPAPSLCAGSADPECSVAGFGSRSSGFPGIP
jgi:hypothetical protein